MCAVAKRVGWIATLLASAAAAGCYRSRAPAGWLPEAEGTQRSAYGAWITLQGQQARSIVAEGELIAIDSDTIHVMVGERLQSFARASICCAETSVHAMSLAELQTWWAAGTISTLTHGFVLILSAPAWLITGALATSSASRAPRIVGTDPIQLRPFARFPQGIPPGLDRSLLRPRSVAAPPLRE